MKEWPRSMRGHSGSEFGSAVQIGHQSGALPPAQRAQTPVVAAAPVTVTLLLTVLFGAVTRTPTLPGCGFG